MYLFITTFCQKRSKEMNRQGFEPVRPPWQAWIIPLDHGGLDGWFTFNMFHRYIYFVLWVVKLLFSFFNHLPFICIWISQHVVKKISRNESTRFRTRTAGVASMNYTPKPRRTWWFTFNLFPKYTYFVLSVVKLLILIFNYLLFI